MPVLVTRLIVFAALFLGLASPAYCQCGTTLPGGTICGNPTAAQGLNQPIHAPVLGIPGVSTGQMGFAGSGSGTATIAAQTAAGTPTLLLPTASGTLAASAASPIVLNATTGQITCPTCQTSLTPPASPNGSVQFNNSGVFGGNSGFTYTAGGPVTITPTINTNTQGLVITHQTPNTGTIGGPNLLNVITVTDQGQNVTGSGLDAFGQILNQTTAFRINETISGGTLTNHFGISVAQNIIASNDGAAAIVGGTYTNVATITGSQWAVDAYCNVGPSGNLNANCTVIESEIVIASAGTIKNAAALSASSGASGVPTGIFAGLIFNAGANPNTGYTGSPALFKDAIYINSSYYSGSVFPIATTGNIMRTDTGTVANVFNFHTLTVTGNILDTPNVTITGAGVATFNGALLVVTNTSGGEAFLTSSANTASGSDGFSALDSSTNNSYFGGVSEAAFTGTIFGVVNPGSWAFSYGAGSTNAGLMVGTRSNAPLILGTNNTNRAEIFASGCFSIGNTTDCGSPGIINLLTGIRIGNAATSGNVLRGNGTNFVSSQLSCSDLSTPCITGNSTLTFGTHLTSGGASYNGSAPVTITSDATSANTVSTIVARDGSGNFSAGAITAVTSLTSPVHYGGSAVGSTLNLQSTSSGSPSGDSITITTGGVVRQTYLSNGNIGAGTETNPQSGLVLSANVTTGIANPSGSVAVINGKDSSAAIFAFQSWGTGQNPTIGMRAANGTAASPSASQSGDVLGFYAACGFGATKYDCGGAASNGVPSSGMYVGAGQTHTDTVAGTFIAFLTVANGGVVRAEAGRFLGSGGLAIGTTTDPGAGSLQLNAQIFMPNITTSSVAQNGTVCWTTGTGKFTVDTTVGCLTSIMGAKTITERLTSARALEIVDQLSPFAFRYKQGWGDSGRYEQFGLGAEEVAFVDERLAGRDPAGNLQGVRYQELTAVLAGAIKELKADNDNLRAELKRAVGSK